MLIAKGLALMQIAISNIAWAAQEDLAVAELLQKLDIHGIDIAPTRIWANPTEVSIQEIDSLKAFWATYGVKLIGMQSLLFGKSEMAVFRDETSRKEMIDYLTSIIKLASELGIRPLVFGSPKNRLIGNLPSQQVTDVAIEFFRRLGEIARTYRTCFCIEPNPPEYGADYITTTEQACELVQAVDHPNFRLHLDSAVMTMNAEDIETSLELAINWLEHFHVSEPNLNMVGNGIVPHHRIAAQLRRLGYNKWVSIEMRSGQSAQNIDAVRTALEYTLQAYK
jgi:D-psicose/D-tagatose/L-ribulose 3-epimerase